MPNVGFCQTLEHAKDLIWIYAKVTHTEHDHVMVLVATMQSLSLTQSDKNLQRNKQLVLSLFQLYHELKPVTKTGVDV